MSPPVLAHCIADDILDCPTVPQLYLYSRDDQVATFSATEAVVSSNCYPPPVVSSNCYPPPVVSSNCYPH
eukprot:SAG11_NODE_21498_length_424_cov_0.729231_1_plen_69_part_01